MYKEKFKRPNGTGSVTKMKGNRRNPFRAVVTLGFNDNGKQNRKTLGYHKSRDEAVKELYKYNNNPYDIDKANATFADVFEVFKKQKYPTISSSNIKGYEAAYEKCEFLYDKKFRSIGVDDLQYVIDASSSNYPSLKKLKILLNQLFNYALPRKLTDQDYSKAVDIEKYRNKNPNQKTKVPFSEEEIGKIVLLDETEIAKVILMLIYSGLRISEFLNLEKKDCNLSENYIKVVKAKTQKGIRKVPIAEKTKEYWQYFFDKDNDTEYLLTLDGRSFEKGKGYTAFKNTYFKPFLKSAELYDHDIHETRHTCSTMLYSAEVYEPKINRILGHSGKTIAESVYTHLDIADLIEAINKI